MEYKSNRPFDLLLEEGTNTSSHKIEFKFNKMLQSNSARKAPRKLAAGLVYVYNDEGQLIGKTELQDASLTGIRVKLLNHTFLPNQEVAIIIAAGGAQFEPVAGVVRWVADIRNNHFSNKHMGIEFTSASAEFTAKLGKQLDLKKAA